MTERKEIIRRCLERYETLLEEQSDVELLGAETMLRIYKIEINGRLNAIRYHLNAMEDEDKLLGETLENVRQSRIDEMVNARAKELREMSDDELEGGVA